MPQSDVQEVFCARCSRLLHPGSGDLYVVRIEATSDPYPPQLPDRDDPDEIRKNIEKLLASLEGESENALRNQVHRTLVLHFCVSCYAEWIENPAR